MSSEAKERRRAFRDIAIQLTASIMIPLTIAGIFFLLFLLGCRFLPQLLIVSADRGNCVAA